MSHLLHLDSSPRGERSHSRQLSGEFVSSWKALHPTDEIVYRDLGRAPVPHIEEQTIVAAFTSPDERTPTLREALRVSDELIAELLDAERYVLGVPMYNFSIPAMLKAYIDLIIMPGRTFTIDSDGSYRGLVQGKKMLIITSRGGLYQPGSPGAALDVQEPFLRIAFGFIGITDITFIHAEGLNTDLREQSLTEVQRTLAERVGAW